LEIATKSSLSNQTNSLCLCCYPVSRPGVLNTRSAHWITAQHLVLSDGLMEGHFVQLCCGFGYQWCCITAGWSSDW